MSKRKASKDTAATEVAAVASAGTSSGAAPAATPAAAPAAAAAAATTAAPAATEMTNFELMLRMFPFSTFLVLIVLLIARTDHVGAWWSMATAYLEVTDAQLGAFIVSVTVIVITGVFVVAALWRARPKKEVVGEAYTKERAALIRFYEATGGTGPNRTWKDRTHWGTTEPVAKWKGVFLNPRTKRVYKIVLADNGLSGELPSDIFVDLPELIEIDLRENQIGGPLPVEICSLPKLEGLYLYENRFTGKIPLGFAESPMKENLTGIFLFNNRFDNFLEARELFQHTLRPDCYIYV